MRFHQEMYVFSFSLDMPVIFKKKRDLLFLRKREISSSLFPLPYAFLLHYANEEGCHLLSSSSTIGQYTGRRRIHVQAEGVSQFRGWILPSPYLWADYVTAWHGRSVKCCRQMCSSFARFEG
ncbi:hypothetical protein ILYODFUR_033521 [Ilyodon furcidens]|uniref:Uncharacterized protein n=1 Tax=Ilyodon furcidens TaxID=33524 RepID=A0ABV0U465_9TELE